MFFVSDSQTHHISSTRRRDKGREGERGGPARQPVIPSIGGTGSDSQPV